VNKSHLYFTNILDSPYIYIWHPTTYHYCIRLICSGKGNTSLTTSSTRHLHSFSTVFQRLHVDRYSRETNHVYMVHIPIGDDASMHGTEGHLCREGFDCLGLVESAKADVVDFVEVFLDGQRAALHEPAESGPVDLVKVLLTLAVRETTDRLSKDISTSQAVELS